MCDGKKCCGCGHQPGPQTFAFDGDQGSNTGMGAFFIPAPVVTPEVHGRAMREIIMPTIKGMKKDGIPFTGFSPA
jgi:phosphoribosylamine--glycine ligase